MDDRAETTEDLTRYMRAWRYAAWSGAVGSLALLMVGLAAASKAVFDSLPVAMLAVLVVMASSPASLVLWDRARAYSADVPSIWRLLGEWSVGLLLAYAAFSFDCMLGAATRAAATPVVSEWYTSQAGDPAVAVAAFAAWGVFCCMRAGVGVPRRRLLLWFGGLGGALPLLVLLLGTPVGLMIGAA